MPKLITAILFILFLMPSSLWSESLEKTAGEFRVVCFGDSITGHRPSERFKYQSNYLKYSDLLELLLSGAHHPIPVKVINSGWAGDMTRPKKNEGWPGALGRLKEDLLVFEPHVAVVLIGGNDPAKTDEQRALTQKNLMAIFSQLKAAGVRTLALQYHQAMPAQKNAHKGWKLAEQANAAIARAAEANGFPILDMGPPMEAAAKLHGAKALVDANDGVHLRLRAESVFARAIFEKLKALDWVP